MDPAPPPKAEVDAEEKPEWFSTLQPRMQRRLIVVGVVILVVGFLGGFAAGFKVEQNLAETNDAKAKPPELNAVAQRVGVLSGVVSATATDSITIASLNGFTVKIKLPATLGVKKEVKASRADITVGGALLQTGTELSAGNYDAAEIIVLPADSKFTRLKVTAVKGAKVSVVQGSTALTVNVKPTTAVYKLDASSLTQIAKGSKVLVNGLGGYGGDTFFANEIVILDPGSAFAKR